MSYCGTYTVRFASGYILRDNVIVTPRADESLKQACRRRFGEIWRPTHKDPATGATYDFGPAGKVTVQP